jgi:hypothetical protein
VSLKAKIIHEVRKTALVTIYFLIGFNLLALLLALMAPGFRDSRTLFASATVAALLVGKVMVVTEGLMRRRLSRGHSFLRTVLTKSVIFTVVILVAMAFEEVLHGVIADDLTWGAAWHHLREEASWARFAARSVYLVVLFGLYSFIFELDQFFGADGVADIVLSRYRQPVATEAWVMRMGLVEPVPAERDAERARIAQELYPAVERVVTEHGAALEWYSGKRGVVFVPDGPDAGPRCVALFTDVQRVVEGHADAIRTRLGVEPTLKAGVARGIVHAVEVVGQDTRRIVRDGGAVDAAAELDLRNARSAMLFAEELGDVLREAGLDPQPHAGDDGSPAWVVEPARGGDAP